MATERNKTILHIIILIAATIACLAPFADKAFNIDDPLFIWAAKHIQASPANPYGFNISWDVISKPMYEVTKNPPLNSYFIALGAKFIGWDERGLHLLFLIPAILVVTGTYFLAKRFCTYPLLAGFICLLSPVFLISSSTIMCDTMMLSFWVWAVIAWLKGIDEDNQLMLLSAAILIPLAALTKYFGMALIPLLLIYAMLKKRSFGSWALYFIIPVVVLGWYQWATKNLYGRGLLFDAGSYALSANLGQNIISKTLIALAFAGGSAIALFFYIPLLFRRRQLLAAAIASVLIIALVSSIKIIGNLSLRDAGGIRWGIILQFSILIITGISALVISFLDFWNKKEPGPFLLLLWVAGAFIFAGYINWVVNGRSVLPMVPAVAILLVRKLEENFGQKLRLKIFLPLIPAAIAALILLAADCKSANNFRAAASDICNKYGKMQQSLWFQGHWGFQYYMEKGGGKFFDAGKIRESLAQGAFLAVSETSDAKFTLPVDFRVVTRELVKTESFPLASVMNEYLGAGFYSSGFGPIPFLFLRAPEERAYVLLVRQNKDEFNRIIGAVFGGSAKDDASKEILNDTLLLMGMQVQLNAAGVNKLAGTYFNRGNAYARKGDLEGAISDYTQSAILRPYYSDKLYINRGDVYLRAGELGLAGDDYKKALEINPHNKEARDKLGKARGI